MHATDTMSSCSPNFAGPVSGADKPDLEVGNGVWSTHSYSTGITFESFSYGLKGPESPQEGDVASVSHKTHLLNFSYVSQ